MKYVYLAGPIADCTMEEVNSWRNYVSGKFDNNIRGVNPIRGETPNMKNGKFVAEDLLTAEVWTDHAIYTKNMYDTKTCDMVFAYLPKKFNDRRPSYGTIMEIAWTIMLEKPLVVVTDDEYIKMYPLITANAGWLVDNLDDGVDMVNQLFSEYRE